MAAYYGPSLGLSPRSALNGARGQSSPMISARMMPDRKSKVDCSTCRTADPARNPCPPTAHAQQYEHVKARGCKFFFPIPAERARGSMVRNGNPRCQVGYIYWDASAHGYVHLRLCSLIIPPHTVHQHRSPSHKVKHHPLAESTSRLLSP